MPMLVICLPTFNESENIEHMVHALGSVLEEHGLAGLVLVIDDNSPDGTGQIADRLAAELSFVRVLHRPAKQGLGPAYLAGFEQALALEADLVAQIDCDFSHDPSDLARLIAASKAADLVLGSRYVEGGGVRNWSLARRLISRFGCFYARLILGLPVRDLTGGFKCFRRPVLEALAFDRITSKGYAFQIEVTYRAANAGFRVSEIPIVFTDRTLGRSKMSRSIVFEALGRVLSLRVRSSFGRL